MKTSEFVTEGVGAAELRRIAVGSLEQPEGTWEGPWSNLDADIAAGRIAMFGAYQLTRTGEKSAPVALGGFAIWDTPTAEQKTGRFILEPGTANALIRLAQQERREDPTIAMTALELGTPGPAAVNFAALLVSPDVRNRGVGSLLYQHGTQEVAERFPNRPIPIFLTVASYNKTAQNLHGKQGFKVLEEPAGVTYTIVRENHHPAMDDHGARPAPMKEATFIYMGKLSVPDRLARD